MRETRNRVLRNDVMTPLELAFQIIEEGRAKNRSTRRDSSSNVPDVSIIRVGSLDNKPKGKNRSQSSSSKGSSSDYDYGTVAGYTMHG